MKRKQVNEILVDQAKRKKKIFNYVSIIVALSFVAIVFFYLFTIFNKPKYVNYNEESNLDYQVYLKDNAFFTGEYIEANNQYVASLIDYIKANFNYKLSVEEKDIDFQYAYRIVANVTVSDKNTHKTLYEFSEDLINSDYSDFNSNSIIVLNKSLDIDYNRYNNLINQFVGAYNLEETESKLNVNMYVNVKGDCDKIENRDTESVISLSLPLATKTVAIDMAHNVTDGENNKIMLCKSAGIKYGFLLVVGVILVAVDIAVIYNLFKYIITTRTAESIYDKELKKILNNYKSYIQKVNNDFDFTGYRVLRIDSFTDMLEIHDTIQEPILMVENKNKNGVYFFIPSKTKIIYSYSLKVMDIKFKMEGRKAEK